jgi:hypothetical protein
MISRTTSFRRRQRLSLLVLPLALLFAGTPADAAKAPAKARKEAEAAAQVVVDATPVVAPDSFEAFEPIVERNIFNPNRTSRVRKTADDAPPPRVDTVTLVGTIDNELGRRAIFESPDAAYRKAMYEGEIIGGLTLTRISSRTVQFTQGERPVTLRVGDQLRRAEGGNWRVAPRDIRAELARTSEAAGLPPIPPDASDVLRRLMEQRQKQLKQ